MTDPAWEPPAVFDIDVAAGTFGGGTVFSYEDAYVGGEYSFWPPS